MKKLTWLQKLGISPVYPIETTFKRPESWAMLPWCAFRAWVENIELALDCGRSKEQVVKLIHNDGYLSHYNKIVLDNAWNSTTDQDLILLIKEEISRLSFSIDVLEQILRE